MLLLSQPEVHTSAAPLIINIDNEININMDAGLSTPVPHAGIEHIEIEDTPPPAPSSPGCESCCRFPSRFQSLEPEASRPHF
ncbi:hypothetical protein N7456_011094 [Penicillium angulare]|uniref:Uncharacterized protein n=1 Tax=Penicillium angulare TaxID=116970 RepID=A0A9W9JZJ8_9EURO|nr:hypothetical protein N7456_011094 [Penicillium angulare]